MNIGDTVLLLNPKQIGKGNPTYDPEPYFIENILGNQTTIMRGQQVLKRNIALLKPMVPQDHISSTAISSKRTVTINHKRTVEINGFEPWVVPDLTVAIYNPQAIVNLQIPTNDFDDMPLLENALEKNDLDFIENLFQEENVDR